MAVNKLNKTFISNQILTALEMNLITNKVDELVDGINTYENNVPDTSEFATKAELEKKVDNSEIVDMLTKTEAASTYQPIGDYLTEIPSEYVTDEELNAKGYATTSQLDGKLSVETYNSDKATFATKEELADKANTSDLSNYLQTSVAESTYVKKSEIPEEYTLPIATAEALGGIKVGAGLSINAETGVLSATGGGTADSVDWANITSKPETFTPSAHNHLISEVTDLQDKLDAKADKTAIADMATKTWVGEQGFLTEHQDISNLATKQEVTEGLATKQDKGDYATTAQLANKVDVSAYTEDKATFALKSELTNLATKDELNLKANSSDLSNYLTTTNAESNYAKKSEIPSLEGYLQTSTADEKYATTSQLSGKQDTLVSGTNIKTINGEAILGSGDIEVEGESTAIVDHGTNDTTFELTPNVLHKWNEVTSLTLTLGAETPNIVNEFMIQFTSGATATQLSLPETVKWLNTPEITANMVYQISILNNLAIIGGWSNE